LTTAAAVTSSPTASQPAEKHTDGEHTRFVAPPPPPPSNQNPGTHMSVQSQITQRAIFTASLMAAALLINNMSAPVNELIQDPPGLRAGEDKLMLFVLYLPPERKPRRQFYSLKSLPFAFSR